MQVVSDQRVERRVGSAARHTVARYIQDFSAYICRLQQACLAGILMGLGWKFIWSDAWPFVQGSEQASCTHPDVSTPHSQTREWGICPNRGKHAGSLQSKKDCNTLLRRPEQTLGSGTLPPPTHPPAHAGQKACSDNFNMRVPHAILYL